MVSVLHGNLIKCLVEFLLSCFYRSNSTYSALLIWYVIVIMSSVDRGWSVFDRC